MDAQRVEILHIADGDAVVVAVPHYLVFYLLPSLQGFLYEYLAGEGKGLGSDGIEFGFVVAETRSQAPQGVCRAHDYWVSQLGGGLPGFFL